MATMSNMEDTLDGVIVTAANENDVKRPFENAPDDNWTWDSDARDIRITHLSPINHIVSKCIGWYASVVV